MTLIATESNITFLMCVLIKRVRHLLITPTRVHLGICGKSLNEDFATSAIQAIGWCAIGMPEMAEDCLNGLMKLLCRKNGWSLILYK